jgi:deoxycytidylate deaminase
LLVDVTRTVDFEIVFGFAAPIGTDLDAVLLKLQDELRVYGYDSESIRLSRLLDVDSGATDTVGYYKARMDKGDDLRRSYGSGDVLAALAAARIIKLRKKEPRERRFAWLLRTLKHEDEVALLRQTYGKRFVLVGVSQALAKRQRYLLGLLKDESPGDSNHASRVEDLVRRDEMDLENEFGQHGRNVYAEADYLIDMDGDLSKEVARMVGLMFGDPFRTPTKDEASMFHAFASALRSADPGRQVGATITSSGGEVLATGSNEVPKFGGGEYWDGDDPDGRDFAQGHDHNKRQTRRTLSEALNALDKGGFLASALSGLSAEERLTRVLSSPEAAMKQTRLLSLIEFGRIVHAEMSALSQAARLGTSVKGGTLYTTAFPCHMCMRLIVASGIDRVVYVDPYPKSLAPEMYSDSTTADRSEQSTKVLIEPFRGASWNIYAQVFTGVNRSRKPDGSFVPFEKPSSRFRLAEAEPLVNAAALEAQIPVALSAAADRTKQAPNKETK